MQPVGQVEAGTVTTPDGRTRTYHLYVPASLPQGTPVPLFVGLHGGLAAASSSRPTAGSTTWPRPTASWRALPDGIGAGPSGDSRRTWNAGDCCGAAQAQDVDDVGFIHQVIDQVSQSHDVDPNRVYAMGHSNGAMLSYRLACQLSDQIVAVGMVSGTRTLDSCTPSQPVSLIQVHGTADDNVPIGGGRGSSSISQVDYNPPVQASTSLAVAPSSAVPTRRSTSRATSPPPPGSPAPRAPRCAWWSSPAAPTPGRAASMTRPTSGPSRTRTTTPPTRWWPSCSATLARPAERAGGPGFVAVGRWSWSGDRAGR